MIIQKMQHNKMRGLNEINNLISSQLAYAVQSRNYVSTKIFETLDILSSMKVPLRSAQVSTINQTLLAEHSLVDS